MTPSLPQVLDTAPVLCGKNPVHTLPPFPLKYFLILNSSYVWRAKPRSSMWFLSTRFSSKNPWKFPRNPHNIKRNMFRAWHDVLPFKCEAMEKIQKASNPRSVIYHRQNFCIWICNCIFQNSVSSKSFTQYHNMREQSVRQAQQRRMYQMQFRINLFSRVFSIIIRSNCGMYVGLRINIMSKTKNRHFIFCQNYLVWGWNSKLSPLVRSRAITANQWLSGNVNIHPNSFNCLISIFDY